MTQLPAAFRMKRLTQKDLPPGFGKLPYTNQLPRGCRLYRNPHPVAGQDIVVAYATGEEDPATSAQGREALLKQVWGNLPLYPKARSR